MVLSLSQALQRKRHESFVSLNIAPLFLSFVTTDS